MSKTAGDIAKDIRERMEHLDGEAKHLRGMASNLDAEREVLSRTLDTLTDQAEIMGTDMIGAALDDAEPGEIVGVALQGDVPVSTLRDVRMETTLTGAAKAAKTPKRKGRPQGSGQRDKDVLRVLKLGAKNGHPQMSVNAIAKALGIKPNYLYRVLPKLAEQGAVRKTDDGWEAL